MGWYNKISRGNFWDIWDIDDASDSAGTSSDDAILNGDSSDPDDLDSNSDDTDDNLNDSNDTDGDSNDTNDTDGDSNDSDDTGDLDEHFSVCIAFCRFRSWSVASNEWWNDNDESNIGDIRDIGDDNNNIDEDDGDDDDDIDNLAFRINDWRTHFLCMFLNFWFVFLGNADVADATRL